MKRVYLLLLFYLCMYSTYGQVTVADELRSRLVGKRKFYDIKNTVEGYYLEKISLLRPADTAQKKQLDRERKKWNRFFYESESHLNSNGHVENAAKRIFDHVSSTEFQNSLSIDATSSGNWTLVGPTYVETGIGRINRVACHPSDPQTLYAGSAAGGLFKTTTTGVAWSNVASFIPSLGISGIVVSHNDPNTIYILTGDGDAYNDGGLNFEYGYLRYSVGVLRSTDGGGSFYRTGEFPVFPADTLFVGYNLVQDPNNANVLLASTNLGIFRTDDGGNTWVQSGFTSINDTRKVFDIEFKPGSSSVVYCTALNNNEECRFYRSEDGGENFIEISIPLMDNATRVEIAVTPANNSYVYLLAGPGGYTMGNNSNDTFKGLFRSTDSGENFTRRSNSPDILGYDDILNTYAHQSRYDLALAASPTDANVVIAGGLVVWRSENGGTDWTEIVDYFSDIDNSNYVHPDVHHLIYNPANNMLLAGTDGGVSISFDHGDNWSQTFNGLSCTQFYKFEVINDEDDMWGGAQDNGTLVRDGNSSEFDNFSGGDGYDVMTDKAPAGNYDDKWWVLNKDIWSDGTVNTTVTPPGTDEFFPNLAMSPTNEDILYAGYSRLFVSYNRGSDWSAFSPGSGFTPGNWCVSSCPTNQKRIYTAGRNSFRSGLYRIDNLDDADPDVITDLTNALESAGYPSSDRPKITDIAVSENGSNVVWVTVSGYEAGQKVYYSTDAGGSWTNISGGLPNLPVHTIVADANDNIYIGTDIGVYYKGNGESAWTAFYNGLPRVAVSELELFFDAGQAEFLLYASTFGRGIWVSDAFGTCPTSITLNSELQGQRFYQASDAINSAANVTGVAGTDVNFRSGGDVDLNPGFTAYAGTAFRAYIGPCNSGLPLSRMAKNEKDSVFSFQKKINDFRLYGKIRDIVVENNSHVSKIHIVQAGLYYLMIYDPATNKYISKTPVDCAVPGEYSVKIPVTDKGIFFLRADLFKGNDLVYMQDFEITQ